MAKHTLANPPQSSDQEVTDLSRWVQQELQKILNKFEGGEAFRYEELHAPPEKLRDGMQAYADGTDWNPGSGEGLYIYVAGAWEKVTTGSGFLSNAYDEVTDGTTPATASGGDVLKFRATAPITVVTGSNHITHGDNVLHALNLALLDPVTPLALDDYIIIRDTSGAVDAKILVSEALKVIDALTEKTVLVDDDLFLILDSAASNVAKKVKKSNVSSVDHPVLIDSGSIGTAQVKNWTGLSAYTYIKLILRGISFTVSATTSIEASADGGSTWTAAEWRVVFVDVTGAAVVTGNDAIGDSLPIFTTVAADSQHAVIEIDSFNAASGQQFIRAFWQDGNSGNGAEGRSMWGPSIGGTTFDALRLVLSTGVFDAGTFELWGIAG